jgi:hypothetical protein
MSGGADQNQETRFTNFISTSLRLDNFHPNVVPCAPQCLTTTSDGPKTDFLISAENEYSSRKCCLIFG